MNDLLEPHGEEYKFEVGFEATYFPAQQTEYQSEWRKKKVISAKWQIAFTPTVTAIYDRIRITTPSGKVILSKLKKKALMAGTEVHFEFSDKDYKPLWFGEIF